MYRAYAYLRAGVECTQSEWHEAQEAFSKAVKEHSSGIGTRWFAPPTGHNNELCQYLHIEEDQHHPFLWASKEITDTFPHVHFGLGILDPAFLYYNVPDPEEEASE